MAKLTDAIVQDQAYGTSTSDVMGDSLREVIKSGVEINVKDSVRNSLLSNPDFKNIKDGKLDTQDFSALKAKLSKRWSSYSDKIFESKLNKETDKLADDAFAFKETSSLISGVIDDTAKALSDNVILTSENESDTTPDSAVSGAIVTESSVTTDSSVMKKVTHARALSDSNLKVTSTKTMEVTTNDTPSENKEESKTELPKTDKILQNFAQEVEQMLDSTGTAISDYGEKFDNYGDNILATSLQPSLNSISDIMETVVQGTVETVLDSDIASYIANPGSIVRNITDGVINQVTRDISTIKYDLVDSTMNSLDSLANDALSDLSKTISDSYSNAMKPVKETIKGWKDNIAESLKYENIKSKLQGDSETVDTGTFESEHDKYIVRPDLSITFESTHQKDIDKPAASDPDSTGYTVTYSPIHREDFLTGSNSSETLSFTNDAYWDVTIVPHKKDDSSNGPPSLNNCYGDSSNTLKLPIVSYEYTGHGIQNQEFELYNGVSMSLPSVFIRPSRFSVTLVDMIYNGNCSSIQKFKDEYVNYVTANNDDARQVLKDFRDCSYEITVTKFSPQWVELKKWGFLGIPEIQDSEQGSSTSSPEYVTLSFAIVGENKEDKTNSSS